MILLILMLVGFPIALAGACWLIQYSKGEVTPEEEELAMWYMMYPDDDIWGL